MSSPADLVLAMTRVRQAHAELLEVIAELELPAGYTRKAALLVDLLRVKPAKATKLVNQALHITEGLTPTGHVTPPALPHVRNVVREGLVDGEHVDVIADVVGKIPDWASAGTAELVEKTLVEQAVAVHPGLVARAGETLLARIDQDGDNPTQDDELADPVNLFRYRRTADGRMSFAGEVDTETAEQLANLIHAFGEIDDRPLPIRQGAAFTDLIRLAASVDETELPTNGGDKPHIIAILYLNDLIDAVGTATLDSGATLPASATRRMACDADIIPVVMSGDSVPLDVGRKYRTVTTDQRRALIARDMGCAFPGCDRPPRWCDGHHIHWWKFGGTTDTNNLVLLCRRHHRLIVRREARVVSNGGERPPSPDHRSGLVKLRAA